MGIDSNAAVGPGFVMIDVVLRQAVQFVRRSFDDTFIIGDIALEHGLIPTELVVELL
ncbi:MAG TPA: hypothetical protein VHW95_06560 [Steroidobacteraceae bacterium]|nr:hypothetical protein [Steroidobacteraceae bacterium]